LVRHLTCSSSSSGVNMRLAIGALVVMVLTALAGYGGYQLGVRSQGVEIARVASVNAERSARIRKALDPKQAGEGRDLLDVAIGQDLFYMQMFEKAAMSDAQYARQRGRSVALVKQAWLELPPFAVEEETRSFIETVCAQTGACPRGSIRPNKPEAKPQPK
jgi:hypothetical protein